jgi:hypothetical protein
LIETVNCEREGRKSGMGYGVCGIWCGESIQLGVETVRGMWYKRWEARMLGCPDVIRRNVKKKPGGWDAGRLDGEQTDE